MKQAGQGFRRRKPEVHYCMMVKLGWFREQSGSLDHRDFRGHLERKATWELKGQREAWDFKDLEVILLNIRFDWKSVYTYTNGK